MNWEVKKEVLAALENWLLSCFYAAPFWKEEYRRRVVQRFEEYVVMCEVARYLRREYKMLVFESDVEGGFWWDGEFMGKPTSCFITYSKAICDWGGRRIYVVESTWWNTDAEDICKDALQTSTRRKHVFAIVEIAVNNFSKAVAVRIGSDEEDGMSVLFGYKQEPARIYIYADAKWKNGNYTCDAYEGDYVEKQEDVKVLRHYIENVLDLIKICTKTYFFRFKKNLIYIRYLSRPANS